MFEIGAREADEVVGEWDGERRAGRAEPDLIGKPSHLFGADAGEVVEKGFFGLVPETSRDFDQGSLKCLPPDKRRRGDLAFDVIERETDFPLAFHSSSLGVVLSGASSFFKKSLKG